MGVHDELFLLEGVAGPAELNLPDRIIHLNVEGHQKMAEFL